MRHSDSSQERRWARDADTLSCPSGVLTGAVSSEGGIVLSGLPLEVEYEGEEHDGSRSEYCSGDESGCFDSGFCGVADG